jgi:ribosomal protein S18 acetylase RimI-like enzyme
LLQSRHEHDPHRSPSREAVRCNGDSVDSRRSLEGCFIPGPELDKLINRRGPQWWDSAIRKGSRIAVLAFGDCVAGYANYGRNRARSLYYDGEIYELYLRPEFQGLGFGRRLFTAARRDLQQSGLQSLVIWALSDNEPAVGFYRALGGKAVARSSERFGTRVLDKVAFAWNR